MKISYTKGRTINCGNYQSLKVEIGIEVDVDVEAENKDEKFEAIKQWVNGKLNHEKAEKF